MEGGSEGKEGKKEGGEGGSGGKEGSGKLPAPLTHNIHDQHGYIARLYLQSNLMLTNQSNQQFRDVFLIERTVVNTLFSPM